VSEANADQYKRLIADLVERALVEDLGDAGDVTSQAIFSADDRAAAVIRSKANGVLSGTALLAPLFSRIDPALVLDMKASDGAMLYPGTEICRLDGRVCAILAGERIALNFLQHLSGIASLTARYVAAIAHTKTRLLDTRKTTPTLRHFEKMAVLHGGGCNHRFGLYDMVLIKDTHVRRAGSVTNALRATMAARDACIARGSTMKIEVEVRSIAEFREALILRPDRIMLDNMPPADMRDCVNLVSAAGKETAELEASGNITLDTIVAVAETGVDFISSGTITHSAPALDIHLVIV
jgi:nicotinate-nucleotide pyrophosphorylase (carboxylating)